MNENKVNSSVTVTRVNPFVGMAATVQTGSDYSTYTVTRVINEDYITVERLIGEEVNTISAKRSKRVLPLVKTWIDNQFYVVGDRRKNPRIEIGLAKDHIDPSF